MDVMSGKTLSIHKQIDKVHHQQTLENREKLKPTLKTIFCVDDNVYHLGHIEITERLT